MSESKVKKALSLTGFMAETYSKDRSTKVGALILGNEGEPLSWGYNGFPRGCDDNKEERHERPLKYLWTEHAERNAIFNAARSGHKLLGSSIIITGLRPCPDCSRAIVQSGISTVYMEQAAFDESNPRVQAWMESWKVSEEILAEGGVTTVVINTDS
jgi:dCMP deaminase